MAFVNEIKKHEQLTEAEFELVVRQMQVKRQAASIRAAHLVLTQDTPAYVASKVMGSSQSNVHDTVKRILSRHHDNMSVYGRRDPDFENATWKLEMRVHL